MKLFGGGNRIRTGDKGFADLCLTTWLCRHIKMERKTGFEPATPTLARWCSTTELLPLKWLGQLDSNQRMTVPKTVALPLGYGPTKGDRWESNPRMPEPQSGALTTSPRPPYDRGSRNRTHIKGFGDLRFTIKLYPYILC